MYLIKSLRVSRFYDCKSEYAWQSDTQFRLVLLSRYSVACFALWYIFGCESAQGIVICTFLLFRRFLFCFSFSFTFGTHKRSLSLSHTHLLAYIAQIKAFEYNNGLVLFTSIERGHRRERATKKNNIIENGNQNVSFCNTFQIDSGLSVDVCVCVLPSPSARHSNQMPQSCSAFFFTGPNVNRTSGGLVPGDPRSEMMTAFPISLFYLQFFGGNIMSDIIKAGAGRILAHTHQRKKNLEQVLGGKKPGAQSLWHSDAKS